MERLRRALRGRLGWNSPLYRFGAQSLNLIVTLRRDGLRTAIRLRRLAFAPAAEPNVAFQFSTLSHTFHLRPGTKDASVAVDNFIREEYAAIAPPSDPVVLLDGGAYIGDTSAFFLSKYPRLRSIAFEPMPDSFHLAEKNLAPYVGRVELFNIALTADGSPVRMSGEQTGARAGNQGDIVVKSRTIPSVLATLPEKRIDILKLDIEGAEGPIFANNPAAWLPQVGFIIIETHGPTVTETVLSTLKAAGWRIKRVRNLYFCQPAKS
ncbi:methyltransferase, FkbM family [Marinovum algicola DG 898]|nr:methyltransferase, FkbM family [Marinovum algicola DG 898]